MANPTTKTWFRNSPENPNIKSFYRSITSTSNRVNGVVLKKQTPHGAMTGVIKRRIRAGKADERGMVDPGADTGFPRVFDAEMSQCTQRALAKFEGKVRKGSANLGVTIAQWGQANEMIIHRLDQVAGLLGKRVKTLEQQQKHAKRPKKFGEQALASQVLEVEFGWKPLFDDLRACMDTVCQDGIPPTYVAGRHKEMINVAAVPKFSIYGWTSDAYLGSISSTIAADVFITNPNLWLLNRLGLINPVGVLWDAIPWSFLVGAFVNVNAMISSLTNEVGLSVRNKSVTETSRILWTTSAALTVYNDGSYCQSQIHQHRKARSLGSFPARQWQVRVPDVSFETALILSSLVVQRATRISSLIRKSLS